eukprot:TRINITY_DN546_c0_g1_i2.p1 TRINITY_DN546_c0_g1~~TRINITY_DN546_c0_g1_i2.p1  ORF type:complete len:190 (-),score=26.54 TRINITY_DN546_c0_g1_i2:242-811(-)
MASFMPMSRSTFLKLASIAILTPTLPVVIPLCLILLFISLPIWFPLVLGFSLLYMWKDIRNQSSVRSPVEVTMEVLEVTDAPIVLMEEDFVDVFKEIPRDQSVINPDEFVEASETLYAGDSPLATSQKEVDEVPPVTEEEVATVVLDDEVPVKSMNGWDFIKSYNVPALLFPPSKTSNGLVTSVSSNSS